MVKFPNRHIAKASWIRLDREGVDSAQIVAADDKYTLRGEARFLEDDLESSVDYELDTSLDYRSLGGTVRHRNISGNRQYVFRRVQSTWFLNDQAQERVKGLLDLDFGFTPATNYFQIKRHALKIGERVEFNTAWFDLVSEELVPLSQVYKRISELYFDYESPETSYRATLILSPEGFVRDYPGLWKMVE